MAYSFRSRVLRQMVILFVCGCSAAEFSFAPPSSDSISSPDDQPVRGDVGPWDESDIDSSLAFKITPAFCCDPRSMEFEARIPDEQKGRRATFRWDFGDGRRAVGAKTAHTYDWPGDYVVILEAEFPDGMIAVAENALSIPTTPLPSSQPSVPDADDLETNVEVIANAGSNLRAISGTTVTLNGAGSRGTGTSPLIFAWRQIEGVAVALVNRTQRTATFTAPASDEGEMTLMFELAVTQGRVLSTDLVMVVVAPSPLATPPVRFAVTSQSGVFSPFHSVSSESSDKKVTTFVGDACTATIEALPGREFELTIFARTDLANVWFPWFPSRYACDRILYPHLMGIEIDNAKLDEGRWSRNDRAIYPGQLVFPGAVLEREAAGRGVFATNWPPQEVHVLYGRGLVTMRYDEPLRAGQTRKYRVMVVDELAANGVAPWQQAINRYKSWLRDHMHREGLWPVQYPGWLETANGWSNIQLQNYDYPMDEVRYRWEAWGDMFPIVQTWGAMSDRYLGDDEVAGCCLIDPDLHPRNAELPELSQWIRDQSGHVGHYARPRNTEPVAGPHPAAAENREWLLDWLSKNRTEYKANANYLDWFITRPLGPVLEVAAQFRDGVWGDTVCEFAVDVYPTAFMMSGALWGGPDFNTLAGQTLKEAPRSQQGIAFPRLVRYLLDDRVIFLGESNGDHVHWSNNRGADHWGERQAFLMGCKLDWMQRPDAGGADNPAVLAIVDAWRRSGFWNRRPIYADTVGLTNIPPGVDVRRFTGSLGETILVIDNSAGVDSVTLNIDGRPVVIGPVEWLDIRVLPN